MWEEIQSQGEYDSLAPHKIFPQQRQPMMLRKLSLYCSPMIGHLVNTTIIMILNDKEW